VINDATVPTAVVDTWSEANSTASGGSSQGGDVYGGCDGEYGWHVLPEQLIYRSYLASTTAPRMGAVFNLDEREEWKWDLTIGGRIGVLRYGTCDCDCEMPQGWQLDVSAAAFPRLTPVANTIDLEATDYRFGIPLSYGHGRQQWKLAYFHLSSHMGDEFAIRYGALGRRINYSRDAVVLGYSTMPTDDFRVYGEVSAAFKSDISETWHFQFGCEYSQLQRSGPRGSPFFAFNTQLREENNYGGRVTMQGGWQWTSATLGRRCRIGLQYYNGNHEKYQFLHSSEQKIGFGIWYDF
jgi:hypothetical protein